MSKFRFACPACTAVMRAPPEAIGKKVSCLKCGQRILIPHPPQQKTMLGRLVFGDEPAPSAQVRDGDPLAFDQSGDAPDESVDESRDDNASRFAVSSICLGVAGLIFPVVGACIQPLLPVGLVCSILAIVFGNMGRDAPPPTRNLAKWGRITGWIGIGLLIVGAAISFTLLAFILSRANHTMNRLDL